MFYKLVGHKTRVTIQEHITYFPPNERPSKTREKIKYLFTEFAFENSKNTIGQTSKVAKSECLYI